MKNILPWRRKTSFKFSAPRAEPLPEGVALLVGLALTVWLPTLLWCLASNHNLPLDMIAVTEVFGGIVGLGLYANPPAGPLRCVPARQNLPKPSDLGNPKLPKAA